MKTIIFICLLSLATCFGAAPNQGDNNPPSADKPAPMDANQQPPPPSKPNAAINNTTQTVDHSTIKTPSSPSTETVNDKTNATSKMQPTPNTTQNKTEKHDDKNATTVVPTTNAPETSTKVPEVATAPPKPMEPSSNATKLPSISPTTVSPKTIKPTEKINPDAAEKIVEVYKRGFDGGSFIGGIVLTLSLIAVGFVGLKYYKTRTERNYHTL